MAGINYVEAAKFDRSFTTMAVKNPGVSKVANAFSRNMTRIVTLIFVGPNLFTNGYDWCGVTKKAMQTIASKTLPASLPAETQAELNAEASRLFEEQEKHRDIEDPDRKTVAAFGFFNFEHFMANSGEGGHLAISAILTSSTVLGWSAFETLAADLWVAAVDQRESLARKFISRQPAKGEAEGKKLNISDLEDFGWDLRGKWGKFLKHAERVKLDRLAKIDRAFRDVFDKSYDSVVTKPLRVDLKAIEAMRNMIVHRGGIVDQKYIDQLNEIKAANVSPPTIDQELDLDGPMVGRLLDSVSRSGTELVTFVDDWLLNNV